MNKQGTLLIVDDNRSILTALQMLLADKFANIITTHNPNTIPATLRKSDVDVVLLDMNFRSGINSGNEGLYWLREIKKQDSTVQVVLFTAYADIELAVNGIKEGATDFVVKPWDNEKLITTLLSAYGRRPKHPGKGKAASADDKGMYWGESAAMQRLRTLIEKVAVTDANILITGENGTGKELLAREIHRLSPRRGKPMVTVDMGAVVETLFESELFGHVKGAFTDAKADRPGKFELAEGGTLFLDEIGNLGYGLQAKLLTTLQRRSVTRVGGNESVPVDIRLVCATNRNLEAMTAQGQFREDLLYRINTIHVKLPALRERSEDIVPLAELFLARYAGIYGKTGFTLSDEAKAKLTSLPWQGNIRELEHTIEKAVIISDGTTVETRDIEGQSQPRAPQADKATTIEDMERQLISRTMEQLDNNLSLVAAQLGISRQTLYNKIKKYGL